VRFELANDPGLQWSHLDEPGGVEVTIECQRYADPTPPHHGEARGIDKGVLALCTCSKPAPGFSFGGLINVNNLDVFERPQSVEGPNRCGVPGATTKQRPGLTDDVIGRHDSADTPINKRLRLRVAAVPALLSFGEYILLEAFPMRRRTALVMATIALLGGAACGGGTAGAAISPSASPAVPRGGPVPAQLAGDWTLVADPTFINLNLSGSDYRFEDGSTGKVAVNGSEIDFYNGNPCNLPLPGGIGRYRWTISAGLLKFSPLNSDPCARVTVIADRQGWQRPP